MICYLFQIILYNRPLLSVCHGKCAYLEFLYSYLPYVHLFLVKCVFVCMLAFRHTGQPKKSNVQYSVSWSTCYSTQPIAYSNIVLPRSFALCISLRFYTACLVNMCNSACPSLLDTSGAVTHLKGNCKDDTS